MMVICQAERRRRRRGGGSGHFHGGGSIIIPLSYTREARRERRRRKRKTPFFCRCSLIFSPPTAAIAGKREVLAEFFRLPTGRLAWWNPPPQGGIRWGANGISDGGGASSFPPPRNAHGCTKGERKRRSRPQQQQPKMPAFFHANYHCPLAMAVKG